MVVQEAFVVSWARRRKFRDGFCGKTGHMKADARSPAWLARVQAVTRPTFGRAAGIVRMAAESLNRPAEDEKTVCRALIL